MNLAKIKPKKVIMTQFQKLNFYDFSDLPRFPGMIPPP